MAGSRREHRVIDACVLQKPSQGSDERGACSAEAEGWVYLFVKGDFRQPTWVRRSAQTTPISPMPGMTKTSWPPSSPPG
jgi:hypothetical protein